MIVGATNTPRILSVDRLAPGTLIVDDSAPHCFDKPQMIQRLDERGDVLFTEGGVLELPQPVHELRHVPPLLQHLALVDRQSDPRLLTGCTLSALLPSIEGCEHVTNSIGSVAREESVQHLEALWKLRLRGAPLHCEEFVIPSEIVAAFRDRFGVVPLACDTLTP